LFIIILEDVATEDRSEVQVWVSKKFVVEENKEGNMKEKISRRGKYAFELYAVCIFD